MCFCVEFSGRFHHFRRLFVRFRRASVRFCAENGADVGISFGAFCLRVVRYLCVFGASCVYFAFGLRFVGFRNSPKTRGNRPGK